MGPEKSVSRGIRNPTIVTPLIDKVRLHKLSIAITWLVELVRPNRDCTYFFSSVLGLGVQYSMSGDDIVKTFMDSPEYVIT